MIDINRRDFLKLTAAGIGALAGNNLLQKAERIFAPRLTAEYLAEPPPILDPHHQTKKELTQKQFSSLIPILTAGAAALITQDKRSLALLALVTAGCSSEIKQGPQIISTETWSALPGPEKILQIIQGNIPQSWQEQANSPTTLIKTIAQDCLNSVDQTFLTKTGPPNLPVATIITTTAAEFQTAIATPAAGLSAESQTSLLSTSSACVLPIPNQDNTATVSQTIIIRTEDDLRRYFPGAANLKSEEIALLAQIMLDETFHEKIHTVGRPNFIFSAAESQQILALLANVNFIGEGARIPLKINSQFGPTLNITVHRNNEPGTENFSIFYYHEESRNALVRYWLAQDITANEAAIQTLISIPDLEIAKLMKDVFGLIGITDLTEWYRQTSSLKFPDLINWYKTKADSQNYRLAEPDIVALLVRLNSDVRDIYARPLTAAIAADPKLTQMEFESIRRLNFNQIKEDLNRFRL